MRPFSLAHPPLVQDYCVWDVRRCDNPNPPPRGEGGRQAGGVLCGAQTPPQPLPTRGRGFTRRSVWGFRPAPQQMEVSP
jgi:hypothetical protein